MDIIDTELSNHFDDNSDLRLEGSDNFRIDLLINKLRGIYSNAEIAKKNIRHLLNDQNKIDISTFLDNLTIIMEHLNSLIEICLSIQSISQYDDLQSLYLCSLHIISSQIKSVIKTVLIKTNITDYMRKKFAINYFYELRNELKVLILQVTRREKVLVSLYQSQDTALQHQQALLTLSSNDVVTKIQTEFQSLLETIRTYSLKSMFPMPIVYICYARHTITDEQEKWVPAFLKTYCDHLNSAGIVTYLDINDCNNGYSPTKHMAKIQKCSHVILIGTQSLKKKDLDASHRVHAELNLIRTAMRSGRPKVIPLLLSGDYEISFPIEFLRYTTIESFIEKGYLAHLQQMIKFLIMNNDPNETYDSLWFIFNQKYLANFPNLLNMSPQQIVAPPRMSGSLVMTRLEPKSGLSSRFFKHTPMLLASDIEEDHPPQPNRASDLVLTIDSDSPISCPERLVMVDDPTPNTLLFERRLYSNKYTRFLTYCNNLVFAGGGNRGMSYLSWQNYYFMDGGFSDNTGLYVHLRTYQYSEIFRTSHTYYTNQQLDDTSITELQVSETSEIASSYYDLGNLFFYSNLNTALFSYQHALSIWGQSIENRTSIINTLFNIGSLYLQIRQFSQSSFYLGEALNFAEADHFNHPIALTLIRICLGDLHFHLGDPTFALNHYTIAKFIYDHHEEQQEIEHLCLDFKISLCNCLIRTKLTSSTITELENISSHADQLPLKSIEMHMMLAECCIQLKDLLLAEYALSEALTLQRKYLPEATHIHAVTLIYLGKVHFDLNNIVEAKYYYDEAADLLQGDHLNIMTDMNNLLQTYLQDLRDLDNQKLNIVKL